MRELPRYPDLPTGTTYVWNNTLIDVKRKILWCHDPYNGPGSIWLPWWSRLYQAAMLLPPERAAAAAAAAAAAVTCTVDRTRTGQA
jgi:hypothetical protein